MGLAPTEVDAFLNMLLDYGLEEFEGFGIRVKFREYTAPHDSQHEGRDADPKRAERQASQATQWHHPALWGPQGKPPEFSK